MYNDSLQEHFTDCSDIILGKAMQKHCAVLCFTTYTVSLRLSYILVQIAMDWFYILMKVVLHCEEGIPMALQLD